MTPAELIAKGHGYESSRTESSYDTGAKVVVNSLFDSKEPGFLTQDLLLVELPGKTYIDVSWFPEHDPMGAYTISVLRGAIRSTMKKQGPLSKLC